MTTKTFNAIAMVSKYSSFDPAKPVETADAQTLTFFRPDLLDEAGDAPGYLSEYVHVGAATITVEIIDRDTKTANAVKSLRAQKTKKQAEMQAEITRIDEQIQNLLAISYEPA